MFCFILNIYIYIWSGKNCLKKVPHGEDRFAIVLWKFSVDESKIDEWKKKGLHPKDLVKKGK